jgi:post-segregation antitoxin (ccd killing protein)
MVTSVTNPWEAMQLLKGGAAEESKKVGEAINQAIAQNAGKAWQMQIKEATDKFNQALANMDQEGIKNANERLGKLRQQSAIAQGFKQIRDAGAGMAKDVGKAGEEAANGLKVIEEKANNAHQAMQKLQGVMAFSNEGFARLIEHQDFLSSRNTGAPVPNRATGAGIMDNKKNEALLAKIADNTAKTVKNTEDSPIPGLKIANI